MRQLHFKVIAESEQALKDRVNRIANDLKALPNVEIKTDWFIRECHFGEPEPSIDYRLSCYVSKDRQTTWEQIMGIINNIKAVPYDFVK